DEFLVAPVQGGAMPGGGGSVGGGDDELAAGGADMWIREVRHELTDALRIEPLARVREDHDFTAYGRHEGVDDRRLASMLLEGAYAHAKPLVAACAFDGVIGRSIRPDHDFQLLSRIVEGQQVLDSFPNPLRLVMGDDDDGHGRLDRRTPS